MTNKKSDLTMFLQIPDDVHLLYGKITQGNSSFAPFFTIYPLKKCLHHHHRVVESQKLPFNQPDMLIRLFCELAATLQTGNV
jgi:hypothetical protein